jgi:hypothetical protein
MTASDEFAWDDVADHIVQQAVERVAIYSNPHGDVVIRGDSGWPEHDAFIVIARAKCTADRTSHPPRGWHRCRRHGADLAGESRSKEPDRRRAPTSPTRETARNVSATVSERFREP